MWEKQQNTPNLKFKKSDNVKYNNNNKIMLFGVKYWIKSVAWIYQAPSSRNTPSLSSKANSSPPVNTHAHTHTHTSNEQCDYCMHVYVCMCAMEPYFLELTDCSLYATQLKTINTIHWIPIPIQWTPHLSNNPEWDRAFHLSERHTANWRWRDATHTYAHTQSKKIQSHGPPRYTPLLACAGASANWPQKVGAGVSLGIGQF